MRYGVLSLSRKETGNKSPVVLSSTLLPLRIFMGVTFFYAGAQHLTDPSYFDPNKPGFVGHLISQYSVGSPIHDFLLGVAQPNAVAFGYLVACGEVLIGTAILLGFLYRVAAFAGLLLNFVFFLSATWNAFPFYFGSDIVFVMCWLTLLLTGPQPRLSIDSLLAERYSSVKWLSPRLAEQRIAASPEPQSTPPKHVQLPANAKLYPKQVTEINRAFDRIDLQFVAHPETQTILEFARAFVISLGVDRVDAKRMLTGLQTIVNRETWEQKQ